MHLLRAGAGALVQARLSHSVPVGPGVGSGRKTVGSALGDGAAERAEDVPEGPVSGGPVQRIVQAAALVHLCGKERANGSAHG